MTIFLRFPDASTFLASMLAGFTNNGETGWPLPDGVTAISIVGAVEGVAGYHVNALGDIPPQWQQYIVTPEPATPWRVFG